MGGVGFFLGDCFYKWVYFWRNVISTLKGFLFISLTSSFSFLAKTALALASLAVAMQLQSARDMALLHLILPVCIASSVVLWTCSVCDLSMSFTLFSANVGSLSLHSM